MILEARALRYTYAGTSRPALDGLDFNLEPGEVFGFLGPNGSGKTTTQKLLTRILRGYEGAIEVLGRDLRGHDDDYFNDIGVCFELPTLYEKLTAEENLAFYAAFFDGPTEPIPALLDRLDLPTGDRKPVGQWSKGMRMRLTLARSLLNRPRLWFLDEPTTGQDPQHAVLIRGLIRAQARQGTSVFLTTHDMTVADQLCDRVAFLVDGRIVRADAPRTLKLEHARRTVQVEYREADELVSCDYDLDLPSDTRALAEGIQTRDVATIHTHEPTLEDVFLEVTGRELTT